MKTSFFHLTGAEVFCAVQIFCFKWINFKLFTVRRRSLFAIEWKCNYDYRWRMTYNQRNLLITRKTFRWKKWINDNRRLLFFFFFFLLNKHSSIGTAEPPGTSKNISNKRLEWDWKGLLNLASSLTTNGRFFNNSLTFNQPIELSTVLSFLKSSSQAASSDFNYHP